MFSIIIPAHNEERVIERTLRGICADMKEGEGEVIVVCNGCRDGTAEAARRCGPLVKVLETEIGSKPHALNLGESEARHFPRFYIDADIQISTDSIRRVAAFLEREESLAAAPRMRIDLRGRAWPIRAYYLVWKRMPYCRQQMIGSGVYALSQRGRARFERFPDIIADDDFVRLTFNEQERREVLGSWFRIEAPSSLRAVMRVRRRWAKGCVQLKKLYPGLAKNDQRNYRPYVTKFLRRPRWWPAFVVYSFVVLYGRLAASLHARFAPHDKSWERDETIRNNAAKPAPLTIPPDSRSTSLVANQAR